jgi:hypothetical protein
MPELLLDREDLRLAAAKDLVRLRKTRLDDPVSRSLDR